MDIRGLYLLPALLFMFTFATEECPRRVDKLSGRTCKKKCQNGTCVSPRKECLCDGACGKSCILRSLKCRTLQKRISHGSVQIVPYNMFGAVARYSCDDGYEIRGVARRVCQGDGEWSNEEPDCIISSEVVVNTDCGPPPVVHNARHDREPWATSFEQGVMLQYECNVGFTSNSGSIFRAWCVRSGWVGPNMTCSHAGCPLNHTTIENGGIIPPSQITTGVKLQYFCKHGFFLAGREERECLPDGTWGGREPSCEKVTCGPPPIIQHAIIMDIETGGTFASGQQLTYACDQGYDMTGDPRAMCNTDGDWTWLGIRLMCRPINCGFPGNLVNGWQSGHRFFFGETVSYHCNEGYELIGQRNRTCEENKKWSGSLPQCIAVECSTLRAPLEGMMVGSGNAFGTVLRFECNKGFQLSGSVERRCQANRTWSGEEVFCQARSPDSYSQNKHSSSRWDSPNNQLSIPEVGCQQLKPFYNGMMWGDEGTRVGSEVFFAVGSEIFFSCRVRATFDGLSFSTRCMENGEWSSVPPKCWGQCEVPTILNASLENYREGEWVNSGHDLEYRCKNGLVPDVTNRVRCNNGTWTSTPRCVPAACPRPPPHVDYGLRVFDGLRHNSRAKYICRNGFRLRGMPVDNSFLTCKFGIWTGGKPVCEEFYCPNPGTIANGKIYKNGLRAIFDFRHYIKTIRHGDRILFKCKEGYVLSGPSGATCVNGQWRPPINDPDRKCKPATHAPFPKLWIPFEEMPEN